MTIKMKKKLKKALGIYLPLIIIAFITAAPVIWSIITSFKMPEDVFKLPVRYIPAPATFSNYIENLFHGHEINFPCISSIV